MKRFSRIRSGCAGLTLLEALMAAFIVVVIVTGSFLVFGAISEKSDLLFGDSELRRRIRLVEEFLRQDIERAVPVSELEFYAERDGVPGPRFNPEPFADYGIDGIPNEGEVGYDEDTTSLTCNLDPNCDNFAPPPVPCAIPPPACVTPSFTEGNGILDPGEWLLDIDGNGRFTGEPFLDDGNDQFGLPMPGALVSPNFVWDFSPLLFLSPGPSGGYVFQHEFWPIEPITGNLLDVDGDGMFGPPDYYFGNFLVFQGDPNPPDDLPSTLLVDESARAIDGTNRFRANALDFPTNIQQALAFDYVTRNYQVLSPFGFLDADPVDADGTALGQIGPPSPVNPPQPVITTNNRYDPWEVPLYDYFGGIVNNGDQDSLYLRTRAEVGGQMLPVNVYYRIVYQNFDPRDPTRRRNYAEPYIDQGVTDPDGTPFGANDGIWQRGEPFTDSNQNGVCDPIVDPGERRLQRIVSIPGSSTPIVQDLGPAVRLNVEYYDKLLQRFVAPFSDTGVDGLFSSEEFNATAGVGFGLLGCRDWANDDYFPGISDQPFAPPGIGQPVVIPTGAGVTPTTEGNGVLDLVNDSGIPAGTLNRNPFLSGVAASQLLSPTAFPYPSGSGSFPGENPLEGIKKFGYPESAGTVVWRSNPGRIHPLNARERSPAMAVLDWGAFEPLSNVPASSFDLLASVNITVCNPNTTLFPCFPGPCDLVPGNNANADINFTPGNPTNLYRFSPAAAFDEDGWLRCSGVPDSFAYLDPGDLVFVWAFLIPASAQSQNPGAATVNVPVPPNHYPVVAKRGNRLLLDLSKIPGGAPSPDQLRGVPAVFRTGYLPPALRIDFALEGEVSGIYERDLRVWSIQGRGWRQAGMDAQGVNPSIPIRGTVFTVAPGKGSGRGSPVTPPQTSLR